MDARLNFDIATVISFLSIGLLKFFDEKLQLRLKGDFKKYMRYVRIASGVCILFELSLLFCILFDIGSPSYGNIKNATLALIPLIFCVLTWTSAKDSSKDTVILSGKDLDKKINHFTARGMSPLGMIVGDMDFFGYVISSESDQDRRKNNIEKNTQIKALLRNNIKDIRIVCNKPVSSDDQNRIGYLLKTFQKRIHIKFFNPDTCPSPQIRGRIMAVQNSHIVVITKKVEKSKTYEYSEHKVDSLPGGLFDDLWTVIWSSSEDCPDIISDCEAQYASAISLPKDTKTPDQKYPDKSAAASSRTDDDTREDSLCQTQR